MRTFRFRFIPFHPVFFGLLLTAFSISAQETPRPITPNGQNPAGAQQQQAPKAAAMAAGAGSAATKSKTLNKIQDLLDDQARFGQTPANNPLLADLEKVLIKHSIVSLPQVDVINFGPGTVRLEKPDGTFVTLKPNFGVVMSVGSGLIDLVATNDFAQIQLQHSGNGSCQFWDGDDQRHSILEPAASGAPRKFGVTLGRGLRHYHLEK